MSGAALRAASSYAGYATGTQAGYCRKQASRFRLLAQTEPLAQMRQHLTRLARQYDDFAVCEEKRQRLADAVAMKDGYDRL